MLNRILDGRIASNKQIIDLVQQSLDYLPVLINAFAKGASESNLQISLQIIHHAEQLARGEELTDLPEPIPEQSAATDKQETAYVSQTPEDQSSDEQQVILEIFVKEAKTHLRNIDHYLIVARASDT